MAAIAPSIPIANIPASAVGAASVSLPAASHVKDGDITIVSAGSISPAPANVATGLAGISQHDSNAAFAQLDTGLQGVFGYFQGPPLVPADPGYTILVTLGPPIILEINLTAATFWVTGATAATASTTVGNDGSGDYVAADTITTTINGHNIVYTVTGTEGSDQAIAVAVAAAINADALSAASAGTPVAGVIPLTAKVPGVDGNAITLAVAHSSTHGTYTRSGATFTGGVGFNANIGTRVGLAIDGTTGYYLADPEASNKIATITGKPFSIPDGEGPPNSQGDLSKGFSGDTGARVYISFDLAALAIPQGH